jgi:RecA/RadA recombinase
MKNFLETLPQGKGLYVKSEGRLTPEMIARCGVPFVYDTKDWKVGTCFVLDTNIYEFVANTMRSLIQSNPEKNLYCFVVDSVDGLIPKNDVGKSFEEAQKVAGGPVIASVLMKEISIPLAKRGHMAIFTSQVRANIQISQYSTAPIRQTTATGGNALLHFTNWILEYEPRFKADWILKNPSDKTVDPDKNPLIGHWAKVTIKKSPNEKTNMTFSYPIRYGQVNGKSIWIEKELVDMLLAWEMVEKNGAWYKFSEEFKQLSEDNEITLEQNTFQGESKLFEFLESNEKLKKFLIKYFQDLVNEI